MSILVLGGAGYIGSHAVDQFQKAMPLLLLIIY